MKIKVFLFLSIVYFSGCYNEPEVISTELIKTLVNNAANGYETANDSLHSLFNLQKIPGTPLSTIVDTFRIDGKKFFGVAVQFSDNINNRFAVYDEQLNCYLIDRSLNGSLKMHGSKENEFGYFSLEEEFLTSDSIELKRVSIYRGDQKRFNLAFRTFTMMKTADTVFTHNLYQLSDESIKTSISAPVFSGLNNFNEEYLYDSGKNIYDVRREIYFDQFVMDFISSIKDTLNTFLSVPDAHNG